MNSLVISIGSNSHNRECQIYSCVNWLHSIVNIRMISEVYNTQATNGIDADYLNMVVIADCNDELDIILEKFKNYEAISGRTLQSKIIGVIPIDLDIVIWNNNIIREKDFNQKYFQIGWHQLNK